MKKAYQYLKAQYQRLSTRSRKIIKRTLITLSALFTFWLFCVHYTNFHQVAICRNLFTGEVWLDDEAGFNITPPWVQVARIDTRPFRVSIPSSARNFNSKLISFNPEYWKLFLSYEGFHYYWWRNRFSWNLGHEEEFRGIKDVLLGYAYDSIPPKFLNIESTTK